MSRHVIAVLALAAAGFAARPAVAQVSAPPISGPKNAAARVAAKANARAAEVNAAGTSGPSAPAAPAPAAPASRPQPTPAASAPAPAATPVQAKADTARGTSASARGAKGQITFTREVFDYEPAGRRDPFFSLLASGELRPLLNDLKLVTIIYDPTGRNSVAILRDVTTKDQYRVKVGQTLGRMRVSAIMPKQVNFVVEEFGFSRQESLALNNDIPKARMR